MDSSILSKTLYPRLVRRGENISFHWTNGIVAFRVIVAVTRCGDNLVELFLGNIFEYSLQPCLYLKATANSIYSKHQSWQVRTKETPLAIM